MYKVVKEIRPEAAEMRTAFATTMDELAAQDNSVVYFDCDVINSIGMTGFFQEISGTAVLTAESKKPT